MTRSVFMVLVVALGIAGFAPAQAVGPDVIVGDITTPQNYGSSGNIAAFSIGTTSCNVGTQNLLWQGSTNNHPVIAQNMYRIRGGRIQQIGASWLKHGFTALTQSLCNSCSGVGGSVLGVGCSDPYTASLNGTQSLLGPRSEVNATTGSFPYPFGSPAISNATTSRRIQVSHSDLSPGLNLGATYFVEAQYIAADDAAAGNDDNNSSYRPINVTPTATSYNIAVTGSTVRRLPALYAWQAVDPGVSITTQDVPQDGRFFLGKRVTNLGGGILRHEFALYNLNSNRSASAFTINLPSGTTVSNTGFSDIAYHSGEPYNSTDWAFTQTSNGVTWQCTETFAQNQNANALRWGTMYNFWFDATNTAGNVTVALFKPGTPNQILFPAGGVSWQVNQPAATLTVNGLTNTGNGGPILANLVTSAFAAATISSTVSGNPWDIYTTVGPGIPAGFVTAGGQIANIDFADPTLTALFGGFVQNMGFASAVVPFLTPPTAFNGSAQMAVFNPTSSDGISLSALNEIRIAPCTGGTENYLLQDDAFVQVTLPSSPHCSVPSISFFGTSYTEFYVGSNGMITFNQGDTDPTPTVNEFVQGPPRVAAFWTDLDPSAGGSVSGTSNAQGQLTISFVSVPQFGGGGGGSVDVVFDSVSGALTIGGYSPVPGHTRDSMIGIAPGGGGSSSNVNWPLLVGAGLVSGNPNRAVYRLTTGGVLTGFNSILFPNADASGYIVN